MPEGTQSAVSQGCCRHSVGLRLSGQRSTKRACERQRKREDNTASGQKAYWGKACATRMAAVSRGGNGQSDRERLTRFARHL